MRIEGLDHIHVYVKDMNKALKFFTDALGCKFGEPGLPQRKEEKDREKRGTGTLCAFDAVGLLELIAPSGEERLPYVQEHTDFITQPYNGEGVGILAFKVPDMEAAIAQMKAKGVRLLGRQEVGKMKTAFFHPADCFGVFIEFVEYEEKHPITFSVLESLNK